MQTEIRDLLQHLDDLCDQPPHDTIERIAQMPITWLMKNAAPLSLAAHRMLEGMWLYWIGNWCDEDVEALDWNTAHYTGDADDPLGYQLMKVGFDLRSAGCRVAARLAAPTELKMIRANIPEGNPSAQERAFRTLIVRWMEVLYQQHQSTEDWFGQQLPTSIDILTLLLATQDPYKKQGNTSIVTAIEVQRQIYFIKRRYVPGHLMTLYQAFQFECFVAGLLRTLPWQLGPTTTCLFMASDGNLSYLSSKISGITMTDIRKAASRVSLVSVQASVLAEHLCNVQDRHHENVFIDRFHASPRLIDFANALQDEPDALMLPTPEMPMRDQREYFSRALWIWHPDRLLTEDGETLILEDVVNGILAAKNAIFRLFDRFALLPEERAVVIRRFVLLEHLAQSDVPMTVEQWNRLVRT